MTKADGSVIINTKVDTTGMTSGLKQIEGSVGGLGSALKKLGGIIAAVFAVKKIIEFGASCIELGSDLDEVQNVVDVTFGKMSGAIEQFSKEAAVQFGLSELAAKQYTSTLGAMYKSMGFTEESAAGMSIEMTKLAADMASFYNLDPDTAFQKIRAGISGETEPLKQLGINLSEANLEEYRLAQGIQTSYKAMNQQDKALLRYNYLLSVTKDAQGDFARTSGSWANQMKILRLQFDQIRADLGQGFIAIFTPILQVINKLLQGLAKLASAFKAFTQLITGKKGSSNTSAPSAIGEGDSAVSDIADTYANAADAADDYADAQQGVAQATKKAAKEATKYLSPLDEINRYTKEATEAAEDLAPNISNPGKAGKASNLPSASGGAGGSAGLAAVDFGQLEQGDTVVDKLAQKMKDLYDTIVKGCQPAVNALKNLWDNGLKKLGEFAFNSLLDFYNLFLKPVGAWVMGEGIPRFVNALNDGLMKVNWEKLRTSLQNLWKALAPFAVTVGEGLLWLWENVLVPFRTWTDNEVIPRFLGTLATAVTLVNNILVALQPAWQWFWDNVLLPIASWTGGVFLSIWDGINAALGAFAQWCADNPSVIQAITAGIAAFFAAWQFSKVLTGIDSLIGMISGGSGLLAALGKLAEMLGTGGVVGLAIGAAVAAGVWLYQNWDTIKAKATELKDWLAGRFTAIAAVLKEDWEIMRKAAAEKWELIKTKTHSIWNGLQTFVTGLWNGLVTKVTTTFENIRKTIADKWDLVKTKAESTWNNIKTTLTGKWNSIKSGAAEKFETIKTTIADAWSTIKSNTETKWSNIKDKATNAFKKIKESAEDKFAKVKSIIGDAWSAIKTGVTETFTGDDGVIANFKGFLGDMLESVTNIFTGDDGIISKFTGFLGDLVEGVKNIASDISEAFELAFSGVVDIIKAPINVIIGFINSMIENVVTAINDIVGKINNVGFDLPDWLGGGGWHPNLPYITEYFQIPELAKGAVIPPRAPFLAMLGDQKSGTNVEAPLETIKQAVAEVGGGGNINLTVYLDGKVVYENVIKRGKDQQIWSGHNPFELT